MPRLKTEETELAGVRLVHPPTQFEDFRGDYVETYNRELYREAGITDEFVQDDYSTSSRHVLRGIHGDHSTVKLVSCLHGTVYVVVVNNVEGSPQYRKWQGFTLSDRNRLQIYIPAGFGNSFVTMSETSIFHYKQTQSYDRARQFELKWNDPTLGIWWPVKNPITSWRDDPAISASIVTRTSAQRSSTGGHID